MAVAITRPNSADIAGQASSGGVSTYSSVDIGAAASDRIVVLCVGTEVTSASINSATIDFGSGDTAMLAGEPSNIGAIFSRVFYLPVPTGTTATFKVTYGAAVTAAQNHICAYRVVGAANPDFTLQISDTDSDPISSGAFDVLTNGGGIAVCALAVDTTARTWTGFTEDLDVASASGGFRFTTGTTTTGGSTTVTVSGANGEDGGLSIITFREAAAAFGDVVGATSNHTANITNPFSPLLALNVSVGDLVIVNILEALSLSATTCDDALGNSYTAFGNVTSGTGNLKAYYSIVTNAGQCTPRVTTTAGSDNASIVVVAYKGPFNAIDKNPAFNADSSSPYSATTTGTLSQSDELIVGVFGSGAADVFLNPGPSGARLDKIRQIIAGSNEPSAVTSLVVAATTAIVMTVEGSNTTVDTCCGAASFSKGSDTTNGVASASGTGGSNVVGAQIAAEPGNAAGTGTATGSGTAITPAEAAASGTGASSVVGTAITPAEAAASGTGGSNVVGVAVQITTATAAASGTGGSSVVGAQTAAADGAASGTGVASGAGAQIAAADAAASGTGAASGAGAQIAAATASAAGTGAAAAISFAGAAIASASGTGAANATATVTAAATAAASGTGTATATTTAIQAAAASASGTGAASATGSRIEPATAAASGTGAASGVGEADTGIHSGVASSSGTGTATATSIVGIRRTVHSSWTQRAWMNSRQPLQQDPRPQPISTTRIQGE